VETVIEVQKGNLFDSDVQTLVNAVNCVGVMGKGVALEFRKRFPDMYADYLERCKAGQVHLGEPYLFRGLLLPWILNFPTKDDWRSASKLSDIVNGLRYLACHYKEWGIESLAVPALGCGAGRLEWEVVGPILYRELEALDLDVRLYAPFYVPDHQATVGFLRARAQKVVSGDTPSLEVESRRAPRLGEVW
jgi:O-acetyl-ADP-ribose deacetylase (regulator of RNase III)